MNESPIPPIVIDDGGDIDVYPTVSAACFDLEAVDVLGGAYQVFDSFGRRLRAGVYGGVVALTLDPDATAEPDELERRLREFIDRVGESRIGFRNSEEATLPDLLNTLLEFYRGA